MSGQPHLIPSAPAGGVDAGTLPENGFGAEAPSWWGTMAFMVIEGFTLFLCLLTYIYLRRNFDGFPPPGYAPPSLLVPTANVAVMLASVPVARRVQVAAHHRDPQGVLRASALLVSLGLVILVLRGFELNSLNVRWDSSAYGSAVWFTVGFHTLLLLIDFAESFAIALIFALGKAEKKHYTDASDDIDYWYFVIGAWLMVFVVVFLSPHFM